MESYGTTFSIKRLWTILVVGMVVMFSILLFFGQQIYQQAPPIPEAVKSQSGETLFMRADIEAGQNVWQSIGGMEQGSIWGHGSYLAPDWSADWLHREASALLALQSSHSIAGATAAQNEAMHKAALQEEMRTNSYDPATGAITVSDARAAAIKQVQTHFVSLYVGNDPAALALRKAYAFPVYGRLSPEEARQVSAFYFWTAWGATTNRPGDTITYTSNWPHEPLVGNVPTTGTLLWSLASVILLLAAAGALIAYYAKQFDVWRSDILPEQGMAASDVLSGAVITPSMRATAKYFWVVCALFVTQVLLGIVTAHYAVEGQGLYGLPFAEYLPYAITRTWHTQLAVLWIATAWLATGLYVAPMLAGRDPKFQRFGVNFLFVSLLIIVIGSFAGQWAAVHRFFSNLTANFWFGHQGYEYVDLGRFWQIYLLIGLLLWVALVVRALWPVLQEKGSKSLIYLVLVSALAIGLLYGAGLMWGQHTNIAIMEYWRWWVVHLWVEGMPRRREVAGMPPNTWTQWAKWSRASWIGIGSVMVLPFVLVSANCLALLLGLRRGEIGVLVRHPIDKFANRRVGQQAFHVHPTALQFRIGEVRDQRLLANGVHLHDIASAPALGNGMVPDNGLTDRAAAQPAGCDRRWFLVLAMLIFVGSVFRMFAGHVSA